MNDAENIIEEIKEQEIDFYRKPYAYGKPKANN